MKSAYLTESRIDRQSSLPRTTNPTVISYETWR